MNDNEQKITEFINYVTDKIQYEKSAKFERKCKFLKITSLSFLVISIVLIFLFILRSFINFSSVSSFVVSFFSSTFISYSSWIGLAFFIVSGLMYAWFLDYRTNYNKRLNKRLNQEFFADYLDDFYQKYYELFYQNFYPNHELKFYKIEKDLQREFGYILWFDLNLSNLEPQKIYLKINNDIYYKKEFWNLETYYSVGFSHDSLKDIGKIILFNKLNQTKPAINDEYNYKFHANYRYFDENFDIFGTNKMKVNKIFDPSVILRFETIDAEKYLKEDYLILNDGFASTIYQPFERKYNYLNFNEKDINLKIAKYLLNRIGDDFKRFYKSNALTNLKPFDFFQDYIKIN